MLHEVFMAIFLSYNHPFWSSASEPSVLQPPSHHLEVDVFEILETVETFDTLFLIS